MMKNTQCAPLASWLGEQARAIADLEERARIVLHEENNPVGYHELMVAKATLLTKLIMGARPYLHDLPDAVADSVKATLMGFSRNAAQALQLDSVFYMSALLYPDDHMPGEPNNLEAFIASLES